MQEQERILLVRPRRADHDPDRLSGQHAREYVGLLEDSKHRIRNPHVIQLRHGRDASEAVRVERAQRHDAERMAVEFAVRLHDDRYGREDAKLVVL